MMSCDKLEYQVSQQFLLRDKFFLSRSITIMSRQSLHYTITVQHSDTAKDFSLITSEVLRQVATFVASFINTYVLLHFQHKNDVTIIIKLHRATRLWLVALYKSLTMIVTSFLFKMSQNISIHGTSVNLNTISCYCKVGDQSIVWLLLH